MSDETFWTWSLLTIIVNYPWESLHRQTSQDANRISKSLTVIVCYDSTLKYVNQDILARMWLKDMPKKYNTWQVVKTITNTLKDSRLLRKPNQHLGELNKIWILGCLMLKTCKNLKTSSYNSHGLTLWKGVDFRNLYMTIETVYKHFNNHLEKHAQDSSTQAS